MKSQNQITASVSFDYKAKSYQLSANIDAHILVNIYEEQVLDIIYLQIAKDNNIDTYSYEFEILQSSEITFSNAVGFIKECFKDDRLDISAINKAYVANQLKEIAVKYGLKDSNEIADALKDAYEIGKKCKISLTV